MKYLGVLTLAVFMVWTWDIIHSEASISFETHSGIQERLAALIEQTIKSRKPEASEIIIDKIWTEPISDSKITAHFIYSFKDKVEGGSTVQTTIQGQGVLERQSDDGTDMDKWSLTKVKTTNDAVIFEEGLMVTPDQTQTLANKYLPIDEEGYPLFDEKRITDANIGREILQNLSFAENGAMITTLKNETYIIEAFDEPLVARHFTPWKIQAPFELELEILPTSLSVDDWDRFHGLTKNGVPFVLSRVAQEEFFKLCDDYDDDSITINNKKILVNPWLIADPEVDKEKYWSKIYQTETPRWELEQPTPALVDILPRLKLPKSRVLVLGCGSGNDAAEFAQQGHVVTAVDISPEALQRAKEKFGHLSNLKFIESDLFKLGDDHTHSYDIIFEHTCFCGISPNRRNEMVQLWSRLLAPGGHLLAVLFTMEKRSGPPFGGSEWEYRERLKKIFQFLFWGRIHNSIDRRDGKELLIYGRKK